MKKTKEKMEELLDFMEKEFEHCPWITSLSKENALKEIKNEINEFEIALEKKDIENINEEASDIFRDALLLLFITAKETKTERHEAIERAIKKLKFRKPWILEGKKITKEEAIKIWHERKKIEKRER